MINYFFLTTFFVVKEHAHRRAIGVIVLATFHAPYKSAQEHQGNGEADSNQKNNYSHDKTLLETRFTIKVVNTTTEILLIGMSMAATNGVRWPVTAKLNPTTLYASEIPRLILSMVSADFERDRNRSR